MRIALVFITWHRQRPEGEIASVPRNRPRVSDASKRKSPPSQSPPEHPLPPLKTMLDVNWFAIEEMVGRVPA